MLAHYWNVRGWRGLDEKLAIPELVAVDISGAPSLTICDFLARLI